LSVQDIMEQTVEDIIEEPMEDGVDRSVGTAILSELVFGKDLDALIALIEAERAQKNRKRSVRDLPLEERREYQREAVRKHRAKLRDNKAQGNPQPTRDAVREALADAALMLLAVDGPGADQVRAYLVKAFPGRVGVSMTVTSGARSGKLRPKSLKASAI
jgi:hypothetical protein